MKNATLGLILALFTSACSLQADSTTTSVPQFSIARSDVHTGAISFVTNPANVAKLPDTNKTVEVWLRLSSKAAVSFQKFSQEHLNQQVQVLIGANVATEMHVSSVITNGELDLYFYTPQEAEGVFDALRVK